MAEKDNLELITNISRDKYGERYTEHVIKIYELYVEMADHISTRRQAANSFFLTINSAVVALVGYVNIIAESDKGTAIFYALVALAGMTISYLWYRLVLSYKQLNSGKFKVIHAIEKMLPIRPYDAEWNVLGQGKNPSLYKPFTHIEVVVPWVFFFLHATVLTVSIYTIVTPS